jgi:outer membrane protein OmpA-like peptidoglycan-associated protein
VPVNLSPLQQDLNYDYQGSLNSLIGDFTVGVTFAFVNNIKRSSSDEIKLLKIEAVDAVTKRKIESSIDVRHASRNKKIAFSKGYYRVKKKGTQYPELQATAHARGYFVARQIIDADDTLQREHHIPMKRIHPEESLATLYFKHASTTLVDSSITKISKILETLLLNQQITIIIKGHTSSEGSARLNMRLSRHRAELVKKNLVKQNVNKPRIKTIGLGATDPVYPDDSEKHRAGNRRVEIYVLKMK